jgi:3-oxoacyl-[acyl-carrier protein] reductase
MPYLIPGSVILVTGATGSIGFEIAAQAAELGAVVGVHGSSAGSVAAAIERLKARAPEAVFIAAPADFAVPGAVEAMVEMVAAQAGRLDGVVNSAIRGAPGATGAFLQTDPASYGLLMQNTIAQFQQLCFAVAPHLAKQGGAIVAIGSDSGRFAAPRQSMIGTVWGGVMSFVRNVALELSQQGVRIHFISPSYVENTAIFDRFIGSGSRAESARKRAGLGLPSPKDIAPMCLFLCGPDSAKMTGQIISINGGLNA